MLLQETLYLVIGVNLLAFRSFLFNMNFDTFGNLLETRVASVILT